MSLITNLAAYYKLDESSGNASDASGNSHTLTNTNTVGYAAALINNGADFGTANTNKRLEAGTNLGWDGISPVSFNTWIKVRTAPGSGSLAIFLSLINQLNRSMSHTIQYRFTTGSLAFNITRSDGSTQDLGVYNTTLSTSAFTMLTYTYDGTAGGGHMIGYLNGSQVISVTATITNGTNAGSGAVGTSAIALGDTQGGSPYPASIYQDETGVWNRVLTPTEITSLYNSGAGLAYPFLLTTFQPETGVSNIVAAAHNLAYSLNHLRPALFKPGRAR